MPDSSFEHFTSFIMSQSSLLTSISVACLALPFELAAFKHQLGNTTNNNRCTLLKQVYKDVSAYISIQKQSRTQSNKLTLLIFLHKYMHTYIQTYKHIFVNVYPSSILIHYCIRKKYKRSRNSGGE